MFGSQSSPSLLWASVSPSRNRAVCMAPKLREPHPGSSDRIFKVPGAQGVAGAAEESVPTSRMGKLQQGRREGPGAGASAQETLAP